MIITQTKPEAEIIAALAGTEKLFLVGCGLCAASCQTGGENEVAAWTAKLIALGKSVTGSVVVDSPCDERLTKRDLAKCKEAVAAADALFILTCGVGVQVAADVAGKPVIPVLNTLALAKIQRLGVNHEYCRQCGECVLFDTGGVCPVTRCAKGLRNGPCGGSHDGKCEVEPNRDCAWHIILQRLTPSQKEKMLAVRLPRDHRRKLAENK